MNRLYPESARRTRIYRIVGLAIAWLAPALLPILQYQGFDIGYLASALFWPNARKLILAAGVALQVYRLMRPVTALPKVYEYVEGRGEIGILFLMLIIDISLSFVDIGYDDYGGGPPLYMLFQAIDWLLILGLFMPRARTVIDGNARTITLGEIIPRTHSFDAIKGLGQITTRILRNGAHVGTRYEIAIVFAEGKIQGFQQLDSPSHVQQHIGMLATETGIPIARG